MLFPLSSMLELYCLYSVEYNTIYMVEERMRMRRLWLEGRAGGGGGVILVLYSVLPIAR